eukprot:TRINITY_DN13530_c0_g1_i9.p1 TRINITY_DN13530_c0_g1~~TRINITY_DN13530_c0_g1_i9.p1  ORF type:complete len:1211 (-),score=99.36 TRINITY_DN13530_c0_g1_i9:909-4541(-)
MDSCCDADAAGGFGVSPQLYEKQKVQTPTEDDREACPRHIQQDDNAPAPLFLTPAARRSRSPLGASHSSLQQSGQRPGSTCRTLAAGLRNSCSPRTDPWSERLARYNEANHELASRIRSEVVMCRSLREQQARLSETTSSQSAAFAKALIEQSYEQEPLMDELCGAGQEEFDLHLKLQAEQQSSVTFSGSQDGAAVPSEERGACVKPVSEEEVAWLRSAEEECEALARSCRAGQESVAELSKSVVLERVAATRLSSSVAELKHRTQTLAGRARGLGFRQPSELQTFTVPEALHVDTSASNEWRAASSSTNTDISHAPAKLLLNSMDGRSLVPCGHGADLIDAATEAKRNLCVFDTAMGEYRRSEEQCRSAVSSLGVHRRELERLARDLDWHRLRGCEARDDLGKAISKYNDYKIRLHESRQRGDHLVRKDGLPRDSSSVRSAVGADVTTLASEVRSAALMRDALKVEVQVLRSTLQQDFGVDMAAAAAVPIREDAVLGSFGSLGPDPPLFRGGTAVSTIYDACDPWGLQSQTSGTSWNQRSVENQVFFTFEYMGRVLLTFLAIYFAVCALDVMQSGALIGGAAILEHLWSYHITVHEGISQLRGPLVHFAIGVMASLIFQSCVTVLPALALLASSEVISTDDILPLVVGVNFGSCWTSACTSFFFVVSQDRYRRACAASSLNDLYNLLTAMIILPLTLLPSVTNLLGVASDALEKSLRGAGGFPTIHFLHGLARLLTSRLVLIDDDLLVDRLGPQNQTASEVRLPDSVILRRVTGTHLFSDSPYSDVYVGIMLWCVGIIVLYTCLMFAMRLLPGVLKTSCIPGFFNHNRLSPVVGDYVVASTYALVGVLLQSRTLSASLLLAPIAEGLLAFDKTLPLIVGANLGSALSVTMGMFSHTKLSVAVRLGLSHVLFNVVSAILWFALPSLWTIPTRTAKAVGRLSFRSRSSHILYVTYLFILTPCIILIFNAVGQHSSSRDAGIFYVMICLGAFAMYNLLPEPSTMGMVLKPPTMDPRPTSVWHQSASASGAALLSVATLVLAITSVEWAFLRYKVVGGEIEVSIGPWHACSQMFEKEMPWATAPPAPAMSHSDLHCNSCLASVGCSGQGSWADCAHSCVSFSREALSAACLSLSCPQAAEPRPFANCEEVTASLLEQRQLWPEGDPSLTVAYRGDSQATLAWSAGERCRKLSQFCEPLSPWKAAGGFAIAVLS